jgi:hypothetical protein
MMVLIRKYLQNYMNGRRSLDMSLIEYFSTSYWKDTYQNIFEGSIQILNEGRDGFFGGATDDLIVS